MAAVVAGHFVSEDLVVGAARRGPPGPKTSSEPFRQGSAPSGHTAS